MHSTRRELHAVEVVQRVVQRPLAADRRDVLRHPGQVTRALGVVERLHQVLDEIRGAGCLCARAEHRDDAAGISARTTSPIESSGSADRTRSRLDSCRRIDALRRWSSGPGLDPELVDERPARVLVRLQRLRLTPRAIEREHQLSPKTFAVGMLRHERLELGDQLGVPIELELDRDPLLERAETELLETPDLVLRPEPRTRSPRAAGRAREPAPPRAGARARAARLSRARRTSRSNRGGRAARARAGAGSREPWSRAGPARSPCGAAKRSSGATSPPCAAGSRPRGARSGAPPGRRRSPGGAAARAAHAASVPTARRVGPRRGLRASREPGIRAPRGGCSTPSGR